MKPTTKQIAKACGMSYGAVKKWPLARRERLAKMIERKGCPQVANLLADAQRLCYELSLKIDTTVVLSTCIFSGYSNYNVYFIADDGEYNSVTAQQPITIQSLQATIVKLEEMINGA